jgi:hypothetical protein
MKKLFVLFALAFAALTSYGQGAYQLFSVTPFTQVEKIDGEWKMTVPITLDYNVIKSFGENSIYFVGAGIGAGVDFNGGGNGNINLNIPLTGYVGGQIIPSFPSIAFGGGVNLQTGNPILMINLHFVSSVIIPNVPKAAPRYAPIINNDYKRNEIGFKNEAD